MDAQLVVSSMSEIPNPMALPIHKVGDYKGFEIWKNNSGIKGHIYFRYTAFGKPVVVVNGVTVSSYPVKRMVVYYTPFTSIKSFKDFVKDCVEGV